MGVKILQRLLKNAGKILVNKKYVSTTVLCKLFDG